MHCTLFSSTSGLYSTDDNSSSSRLPAQVVTTWLYRQAGRRSGEKLPFMEMH